LWAAVAVHGLAVSAHARAGADDARLRHQLLALDGLGEALWRGAGNMASGIKAWAALSPTAAVRARELRLRLLAEWRVWRLGQAERAVWGAAAAGALLAAGGGGLAALAAPAGRRGRASRRGLATALLGCALVCLGVGLSSPCLSTAIGLGEIPLLGNVTLENRVLGIPDGIRHLWAHGERFLASTLFVFSLVFPAIKLALLLAAALAADRGPGGWRRARGWASRLGKWSMLEVMVAALVFVQFTLSRDDRSETRIEWGAVFFGAHVALAMLAGLFLGWKDGPPAVIPDGGPPAAVPATEPAMAPAVCAKRRLPLALAGTVAWLAAGWAAWQAAGSIGTLDPARRLAWETERIEFRSQWPFNRPFGVRVRFSGLPGLSDGKIAGHARGQRVSERRTLPFADWAEGEWMTLSFPDLGETPSAAGLGLEVVSRRTGGRAIGGPESPLGGAGDGP